MTEIDRLEKKIDKLTQLVLELATRAEVEDNHEEILGKLEDLEDGAGGYAYEDI